MFRKLLGQEVLLDQLGDLHLLLVAFPLAGLDLLLLDQLRDPQRRSGLPGEVLQQLAVIRGVLLFGQPRTQVEQPDELPLGHQRDHQPHTGPAQRLDRR